MNSRSYSIDDAMEETKQPKGVVEQYRRVLIQYGVIKNNESLNYQHVCMLKEAVKIKEECNVTWESSFKKIIFTEIPEQVYTDFRFDNIMIIKNLIWLIKKKRYEVIKLSSNISSTDDEFHYIFDIIIDNFVLLSQNIDAWEGSAGTDGNPVDTFYARSEQNNDFYLIVGKYDFNSKSEGLHVFYSPQPYFNIMNLRYITGGSTKNGVFKELLDAYFSIINA